MEVALPGEDIIKLALLGFVLLRFMGNVLFFVNYALYLISEIEIAHTTVFEIGRPIALQHSRIIHDTEITDSSGTLEFVCVSLSVGHLLLLQSTGD